MDIRSDWRLRPSAVERTAGSATAAMATAAQSLLGHLELVLSGRLGPLADDQRGFLAAADGQARRLEKLIADLRTVALASSGALDVSWDRCDLAAAAREAALRLGPLADTRERRIELRTAEPVWIIADAAQLERALLELLQHAIDEAPAGGTVAVEVGPSRVEVSYAADGLPARDALGLLLVESIAFLHGGGLGAAAADDLVTLTLSLAAEEPALELGTAAA